MKSNKYWFRPKKYGWGYVPISWEGWVLTIAFILIFIGLANVTGIHDKNASLKNAFYFATGLLVFVFIFHKIAKPLTKGQVKWNWGGK